MIDFRWRVASGNQQHPFTPEALEAIYMYSKGMPREACIIADNSLLAAFLARKTWSIKKPLMPHIKIELVISEKTNPLLKRKQ